MEAPNKIYIHPDIGGREFLRPWLHRPANNESVEYFRKDAFIEKACEWWMDNFEYTDDADVKYKNIWNFKKYMKGE